jgi:3-oxoadipate enol-lactonase
VLLIHGLGGSSRDWALQAPAIAAHFAIISADLRGHGRSDKPRQRYSIPGFAADLAGLVGELNAAPVHVVGLSLGGMVALELALSYPALVRSLVIINSGPRAPASTLRERLGLIATYVRRVATVRLFGMRRMGEVLAGQLLPEPAQAPMRQRLIDHWAENDPRAYLAALRAIGGWDVTARLGELRCPTLVVAAEMDYTPVTFKRTYAARISRAELIVIDGSRHLTPFDRPAELNAAILGFLQTEPMPPQTEAQAARAMLKHE